MKISKRVQVSCYVSFRKWQRFLILDMINWQCFLNLAMKIGQRFRIVSLETGQCFQIVSLEPGNVMIESIALFPRTRFGSVALFPWPNLGSVASLSCPKLGNIATFWRKCSTRLEPFYEFFTHLELEFLNFIYHSWIRKHSSLTYQKLVNQFRVPLTLSVMGYLTVIFSWGGVLKTHSLKPDLTLSNHYANHTM